MGDHGKIFVFLKLNSLVFFNHISFFLGTFVYISIVLANFFSLVVQVDFIDNYNRKDSKEAQKCC